MKIKKIDSNLLSSFIFMIKYNVFYLYNNYYHFTIILIIIIDNLIISQEIYTSYHCY